MRRWGVTKIPASAKPKLSLTIISFNEEANIGRCIRSVPWADEVIVVDSGSTDRTRAIANGLGAKVIEEKWRGYRDQKQFAVDQASNDWILSLDADEALSPESVKELESLFSSQMETFEKYDGFEFPRLSYHMGRWIKHGGWYPDRQLRLFHKARARWAEGHVHERVSAKSVYQLSSPILHWPFRDLTMQVTKNNQYSSLGARDLFDRKKSFSYLKLIFKPVSKFLETYLIKRGFLDGFPGFVISIGAAYSVFLKFAKLRELEAASRPET